MAFPEKGNYMEIDMDRYCTWDEAIEGHEAMVKEMTNTSTGDEG